MEEFARRISGHEDVWYATYGEIYENVKAFHNLELSADGRIVYNPGFLMYGLEYLRNK